MVKYPERGKVKERLAQSIGKIAATDLYKMFIHDTLTTVQSLDIPFHIAVYPPAAQSRFEKWLGSSYQFFQQKGMNLGKRLQNGFLSMFERKYDHVIALAGDSPDLPIGILERAISGFKTHKAVLGPATDGGYYLIGFSHDVFTPDVFENISWSTETVFQETLSKLESITHQILVLPEWADIDTKIDLQQFHERCRSRTSVNLHTMNYLRNHPEILQIL